MTKARSSADFAAGGPNVAGKNAIINGGFDVWQRGTSNVTTLLVYTADRWQKGVNTHFGISRTTVSDTTNLPNIQYAARIQRTSGSSVTSIMDLGYSMESIDTTKYVGQTITLSFYARKGANYSGAAGASFGFALYTGTGTDQSIILGYTGGTATLNTAATLTTSMARYSATVTIPTTATEMGLYFSYTPTGTAGANDYVDITGVQLELGSVATPFSRAGGTIQGELAACQRYYYVHAVGATVAIGVGYNETASSMGTHCKYAVTMRTGPSLVVATGTDYYTFYRNGANDNFNTFIQGASGPQEAAIYNNSEISGTAGHAGNCYTNNANAMVAFNAEL